MNNTLEQNYKPFKWYHILLSFVFFIWSQIAILLVQFEAVSNGKDKYILIASALIGDIFFLGWAYKIIKTSVETKEDKAPPMKPKTIGMIAGLAIIMIFVTGLTSSLIDVSSTQNQDALNDIFTHAPIMMSLHIMLVAPVCEELSFRYFFIKPGKIWTIRFIISGILFLGVHLFDISQINVIIIYLIPVLFLHGIRYKTGSVRYSLALHITYNFIVNISMMISLS